MASGGCYGPPLVPRDLLWHGIDAAAAIEASSCASSKASTMMRKMLQIVDGDHPERLE